MRGVWLTLAVLLLLLTSARADAQSAQYKDILDAYRSGACDAAVADLLRLEERQVERDVRALTAEHTVTFRRDVLQASLVLHLHALLQAGQGLGSLGTPGERGEDRREWGPAHAQFAARLLALLETRFANMEFLRHVYLLMLSYLQGREEGWRALDMLAGLPREIRMHPETQLALGAIHETGWQWRHEDDMGLIGFSPDLGDAEAAYRLAAAGADAVDEASVRLGRVLGLRGKRSEALEVLRQPRADRAFSYLAKLFEGQVHEAQGEMASADAAYAAAATVMPGAHSAQVAMAHLHHVQNRRAAAADRIRSATSSPVDDAPDPWLWYRKGISWRTTRYLEVLQRLVRR